MPWLIFCNIGVMPCKSNELFYGVGVYTNEGPWLPGFVRPFSGLGNIEIEQILKVHRFLMRVTPF